jgi:hypothetical protein
VGSILHEIDKEVDRRLAVRDVVGRPQDIRQAPRRLIAHQQYILGVENPHHVFYGFFVNGNAGVRRIGHGPLGFLEGHIRAQSVNLRPRRRDLAGGKVRKSDDALYHLPLDVVEDALGLALFEKAVNVLHPRLEAPPRWPRGQKVRQRHRGPVERVEQPVGQFYERRRDGRAPLGPGDAQRLGDGFGEDEDDRRHYYYR